MVAQGALAEQATGNYDMQAIDLVGRIFEYVMRDDNLPDTVKAALSYLHTPFLELAFIDQSFDDEQHPARVLLNNN